MGTGPDPRGLQAASDAIEALNEQASYDGIDGTVVSYDDEALVAVSAYLAATAERSGMLLPSEILAAPSPAGEADEPPHGWTQTGPNAMEFLHHGYVMGEPVAAPWLPDESVWFQRLLGWVVTGAWAALAAGDGTHVWWQAWSWPPMVDDSEPMGWVPLTDDPRNEDEPIVVRIDPRLMPGDDLQAFYLSDRSWSEAHK